MSRRCAVCAKGPTVGNKISHAHNMTKRRWLPNLQKIRIATARGVKSAYVCTGCIRTGKVQKVI
jgi:large subunit ribosomal protein L28